jgi:hypothetical protein
VPYNLKALFRDTRKTQAELQKLLDRYGPHAQHNSRDPVEMSLDELCAGLLTIQRAERLITVMAELLQKPLPAEIDADQATLHLCLVNILKKWEAEERA